MVFVEPDIHADTDARDIFANFASWMGFLSGESLNNSVIRSCKDILTLSALVRFLCLTYLLVSLNIFYMSENIKITDPIVAKDKAIKKAGNAAKLAKLLGISRASISGWGDYLPPYQAYRIIQVYPDINEHVNPSQ
ncbi:MAG: Cro/CI family transcriptional regulator [Methylovulum sp.]|nr:Cro/CI family transcriptional regulator [Methylovulum sp.]